MKLLIGSILTLCCATSAFAGFKLPSHVHRAADLEEAVAKAKEKNKALAFVYTDETST